MSFSKLVFVRPHNPIYEDYDKKYSTIRFYSETLIQIAKNLGISEIEIAYIHESYKNQEHKIPKFDLEYNKDLLDETSDKPSVILFQEARAHGIHVKITSINNVSSSSMKDALLVLSFMSDTKKSLEDIFVNKLNRLVQNCKGYIYLSSDNELSSCPYVKKNLMTMLEFIKDCRYFDLYKSKMICIIMTESNSEGIRDLYSKIFDTNVYYMPVIFNERLLHYSELTEEDFYNKSGIMMLRGLEYFKEYKRFLQASQGKLSVYESTMPAIRKRYASLCEDYYIFYKAARFWSLKECEKKISGYKFFIGMSTTGSSRFTTKILEGTNANTVTISPIINLRQAGFSEEEYPDCHRILENSGIGDVFTIDDNISSLACDLKFKYWFEANYNLGYDSYLNKIELQKKFVRDYFLPESESVKECMGYIINYIEGWDRNHESFTFSS